MKLATGAVVLGAVLLALAAYQGQSSLTSSSSSPSRGPSTYVREAFNRWRLQHKLNFKTPQELDYRLSVFSKTLKQIEIENASQSDYVMGLNKFSHLTDEEFIAKYAGLNLPADHERDIRVQESNGVEAPTRIDWRELGAVNPIKDQGQCGSCWAFSATAAVEGIWQISGNALQNQAEQQLVDCSTSFGNQGCNGGFMDYAFKYLITNGGQMATADYPYTAADGTCKFDATKVVAKISNYADVPKDDCATLLEFAGTQPTSVAIAANAIKNYKSGVFTNPLCGTNLNHGVAIVGYSFDTIANKWYWIVRNSWGTSWGEEGYIRMDRNTSPKTGICGICMAASAPKI